MNDPVEDYWKTKKEIVADQTLSTEQPIGEMSTEQLITQFEDSIKHNLPASTALIIMYVEMDNNLAFMDLYPEYFL